MNLAVHIKKFPGTRRLAGFQRIYLGSEVSADLLPNRLKLEQGLSFCEDAGLAMTLTTPWVAQTALKHVLNLIDFFINHARDGEVVVNDWGVLHHVSRHFKCYPLSAGRLLARQRRDPRQALIKGNGENTPWSSDASQQLLAYLGISRLELDALPSEGLASWRFKEYANNDFLAGFSGISWHRPWVILSVAGSPGNETDSMTPTCGAQIFHRDMPVILTRHQNHLTWRIPRKYTVNFNLRLKSLLRNNRKNCGDPIPPGMNDRLVLHPWSWA